MLTKIATAAMKIDATIRLAQLIGQNGTVSEGKRQRVLQDAQEQGVKTIDTLRAHVLLGTGSSAELVRGWLGSIESASSEC